MKEYEITNFFIRHYFIEEPERGHYKGNLASQNDSVADQSVWVLRKSLFKSKLIGAGRGCSDTSKGPRQMYMDVDIWHFGPFVFAKGPWFGWLAKQPEVGFTVEEVGLQAFGWQITFSKAFNMGPSASGKLSWGLMVQFRKFEKRKPGSFKGTKTIDDVLHPQISRMVDPYK